MENELRVVQSALTMKARHLSPIARNLIPRRIIDSSDPFNFDDCPMDLFSRLAHER